MHAQLIGNDVSNSLRVSRRSRAAAVDLISDSCKLVSYTVCNVRSEIATMLLV